LQVFVFLRPAIVMKITEFPSGRLHPRRLQIAAEKPPSGGGRMIRHFEMCLRGTGLGLATALALLCACVSGHAQEFTAEQRAACTPDAFRVCASEIPNIPAISACMRKNARPAEP
jgi:hypothetical protein